MSNSTSPRHPMMIPPKCKDGVVEVLPVETRDDGTRIVTSQCQLKKALFQLQTITSPSNHEEQTLYLIDGVKVSEFTFYQLWRRHGGG